MNYTMGRGRSICVSDNGNGASPELRIRNNHHITRLFFSNTDLYYSYLRNPELKTVMPATNTDPQQ